MTHPQFEGVKVALKQDRTGYILTLSIHPDDLDERILRDFVGARYQVVMVRLNEEEKPMVREPDPVRMAGVLCRDKEFHQYLQGTGAILEASEKEVTDWLRASLGVTSRTELKNNPVATKLLYKINEEFKQWKFGA